MNNAQTQRELSELKAKFQHFVRYGGHFCLACQRIVEKKNDDAPLGECENCGSHRIVFRPAIIPHDTPI